MHVKPRSVGNPQLGANIPACYSSYIGFCLYFLDYKQVESDEDSQASQDSMIVHDVQDSATPDSEISTEQQKTVEPATNTAEFQADWVPPWRIKAGRVPAPPAKAADSEEPTPPWRQPTSLEPTAPWRKPPATEPASLPEQTDSFSDYNSKNLYTVTSSAKKNENDSTEKTPQFLDSSNASQPWLKRFGSKEDLLKPHAPKPWRSEEPGATNSDDNRLTKHSPVPVSDGQQSMGLTRSDGQESLGLMRRSDGEFSTGLTGRISPGAESLSSINSAEERLEAEIMDRLEKEALDEEAAERRHLDVLADEMNDSNLMESSNASSIPIEQVARNIVQV